VAVLDPELTVTQPPRVTALTGIDAIAHAVETFVTNRRNPISLAFSREAWRLLAPHYPRVLEDGNDLSARGAMQLGAFFAGLAIENSMLGAAHALANPLTQFFEIVHGQAVAVMLPHVVRFNGDVADEAYRELLCTLCESNGQTQHNRPSDALAERLHTLLQQAGLATSLQQLGVPREKLEDLAAAAATQWTAQFNPRLVAADDLLRLYEAAYD
jgi:alcohol dehydrogenase